MTREEAIKELEILKQDYWDDDSYGHETKQYDDTMFALDMAIEALGQELILNKIRAEIDAIYKEDMECDGCSDMGMVLDIIDKYKAESEDREND